MTTANEILIRLAALKDAADQINKQYAEEQTRLIEAMEDIGLQSATADVDGTPIRATLVKGERVVLDHEALRDALSDDQWSKVTKEVLDKEALEAAVAMDIVSEKTVADASEVKQNKPYLRVTHRVASKHMPPVGVAKGAVSVNNTAGQPKPAARKRVARPPKP